MKATKTVPQKSSADAQKQLEEFIAKFDSGHQFLIRAVRKALRKRFPTANEFVYDNYNFFVIGYGPTERPSDAILSMAAGANGVGLHFSTVRVSPIRRSSYLAQEIKLASFDLSQWMTWSGPPLKH